MCKVILSVAEGILVHKASFGDQLPKPGTKPQGWEPGEDILFGSLSFTNLQTNVDKLGARKPSNTTNQKMDNKTDEISLDEKLAALKMSTEDSTTAFADEHNQLEHKTNQENQLSLGLPDVVQGPGMTIDRKADHVSEDTHQDTVQQDGTKKVNESKTGDILGDLDSLVSQMKGSRTPSIKSTDSIDSKGSKPSSVNASPAHVSRAVSQSPKFGRDFSPSPNRGFSQSPKSSLSELQDPATFTIGTNEGSKKKIKKADFTDPNRQPTERDPNDPLGSLDPFWTLK